MHYADVFLRKRPQFMEHVVPALAQMAESPDPRAAAALKKVLLQNPRWRASFFEHLPARVVRRAHAAQSAPRHQGDRRSTDQ